MGYLTQLSREEIFLGRPRQANPKTLISYRKFWTLIRNLKLLRGLWECLRIKNYSKTCIKSFLNQKLTSSFSKNKKNPKTTRKGLSIKLWSLWNSLWNWSQKWRNQSNLNKIVNLLKTPKRKKRRNHHLYTKMINKKIFNPWQGNRLKGSKIWRKMLIIFKKHK